jgi:hypothetical protein
MPWKPILTKKPHATISLEDSLLTEVNENSIPQYDPLPKPKPHLTEISYKCNLEELEETWKEREKGIKK